MKPSSDPLHTFRQAAAQVVPVAVHDIAVIGTALQNMQMIHDWEAAAGTPASTFTAHSAAWIDATAASRRCRQPLPHARPDVM
jgi:hypothetical protein